MKTLKKIISEHLRYKNTIFKLAKSDLVKTYKGTALGWWWAIIRPSITLAVYYFAFTVGLKVSSSVGGYSYFLWLIAGFLPWFYMRDVLVAGAGSIKKYRFLVTNKISYFYYPYICKPVPSVYGDNAFSHSNGDLYIFRQDAGYILASVAILYVADVCAFLYMVAFFGHIIHIQQRLFPAGKISHADVVLAFGHNV